MIETTMRTSEVLHKSADLIQERGWTTGSIGWYGPSAAGPLCLEGAIMAALGVDIHQLQHDARDDWHRTLAACPAYQAVSVYLNRDGREDLYLWNDAGRTAEEVIEVLRAAAEVEALKEAKAAEKVAA